MLGRKNSLLMILVLVVSFLLIISAGCKTKKEKAGQEKAEKEVSQPRFTIGMSQCNLGEPGGFK